MKQKQQNQYAEKCRTALIHKIARFGAITTEDFMAHCLTDTQFGYYRHAKLGADFITAPMMSKEFGKAVGTWVEINWKRLSKPREVILLEAGAGRGELLHDVLFYLQENCPELIPCLFIQLIEVNQSLRQKQAQVIADFLHKSASSCKLRGAAWCENIEDVPEGTYIFIANEFFDALPTRQYILSPVSQQDRLQKSSQSSSQQYQSFMRRIAISRDSGGEEVSLRFVRAEQRALPPILINETQQGKEQQEKQKPQERIVEISPRTLAITSNLAQMLVRFGGAIFICDYGYSSQRQAKKGGSLQAFLRHKVVDPLFYCGACDLSVEVDFASIASEFSRLDECGIETQREFLLADKAFAQEGRNSVIAERNKRLLGKNAMGERFKVLTAFSKIPH